MRLVLMFDSFFFESLLEDIFPFEHINFSSKERKTSPIKRKRSPGILPEFLGI